ncbi:hypothetical protein CBS101457_006446 [Exobasidium rhododendri]|nr:hypothetical protein CBS101457_006446 [Exobasidium rhododendri]
MDHGGMHMPMPEHGHHDASEMQCMMSMTFNTSTKGLCVVFSSWIVTDTASLAATLLALFVLAMLSEYLRLRSRSLDVHLINSYQLANGVSSALNSPQSHRRKASIQQKRYSSQGVGSSILSPGFNALIGDRRKPHTESSGSSLLASDDDAPLLPGPASSSDVRKASLWSRLTHALLPTMSISRTSQLRRTTLYVTSLTLSMFLMLVFMTYNAWLIAAVLSGAATGHYLFSRDLSIGRFAEEKGIACH